MAEDLPFVLAHALYHRLIHSGKNKNDLALPPAAGEQPYNLGTT